MFFTSKTVMERKTDFCMFQRVGGRCEPILLICV